MVIYMCSVGESYGVDIDDDIPTKKYMCNKCGNKFKGMGRNVSCPGCQSKDVNEHK